MLTLAIRNLLVLAFFVKCKKLLSFKEMIYFIK